ncbi:MAG TPA: hypothetical protein VEC99_12890 [Clostridia bacterium]|nr:hypothetical protein [Clostridia bacterium]
MGILSDLFKKREKPEPYDWDFLKEQCLEAIDARVLPAELMESPIEDLDYDRLSATGDDAEEVVIEIWAVLKNAKTPEFSPVQAQEYLYRAGEMLRTDIGPEAAAARLREIEACLRKQ